MNNENRIDQLETQLKQVESRLGAVCSSFYSYVFAQVQELKKQGEGESLCMAQAEMSLELMADAMGIGSELRSLLEGGELPVDFLDGQPVELAGLAIPKGAE
ncbi:hypothetical protein [Endozoicomonas arenosclerae]|uniref:hypothetical protein n=1 Tax=Endozoicomonas arenosclerae TaxID=1633495 RepID=UPI0007820E5A|nr:hypothetical protein [Endozoicomonas arenosclerae]